MKTLAALLLTLSALSTGCLCGGFTGGGDRVLARNSDSIILCDNGGFIATTAAVVEGRYVTGADATITATRGDDATTAFVLTWSTDGSTATTTDLGTDLGDGTWTKRDMNMVELDHADVQCQELVSRSWWSAE